jgi:hypothetical protein
VKLPVDYSERCLAIDEQLENFKPSSPTFLTVMFSLQYPTLLSNV